MAVIASTKEISRILVNLIRLLDGVLRPEEIRTTVWSIGDVADARSRTSAHKDLELNSKRWDGLLFAIASRSTEAATCSGTRMARERRGAGTLDSEGEFPDRSEARFAG